MAVPQPITKSEWRAVLRARRRAYAATHGFWPNQEFPVPLMARLRGATCISGYIASNGEPDVRALLKAGAAAGAMLCFPFINQMRDSMTFRVAAADGPFDAGPFGAQPAPTAAAAHPDLILLPLLGFTRSGARLGQGGGFYDQALTAHPDAFRLGIAWAVQDCDTLPIEPHDMPLHAILTDKEWIEI